jgi:hypothetical protein
MTRMLPATIHSSVKSAAERRMFDVIRNAPGSDEWVCVHSLGLARHDYKRRGEIDFALLTPEGVVVLEVKGGRIERSGGGWAFIDRYGTRHTKRESPFDQAASAMFALERELRDHFGRASRLGQVLLGSAVMLPDIEFNALGVEADRRQLYDVRDSQRPLNVWVRELFLYLRSLPGTARNGLSKPELERLADYLRGDFEFLPAFGIAADDVKRNQCRLTRQQAASLPPLESEPRLLVQGSAGTGKTLLALESARRAAANGRRVLVLCFNRMLARSLKAALAPTPGVEVHHLHGYLRAVIERSALSQEFEAAVAREGGRSGAFERLYPEYAALALSEDCDGRYDCLVLDEAQDFLSKAMFDALDQSLVDGLEQGCWRVFLDANDQAAMYGQLDPSVFTHLAHLAPKVLLSINCRNTRPIELATRVVVEPRSSAEAMQDGEPVERRWYADDKGLADEVCRVLDDLDCEGVPRGRITVLYPSAQPSLLRALAAKGVAPVTADMVAAWGDRRCAAHSTTSAFKGLEDDVVVLAGVSEVIAPWWRAVNYVGMSRARVRLVVLLDARVKETVEARFDRQFRATLEEEIL